MLKPGGQESLQPPQGLFLRSEHNEEVPSAAQRLHHITSHHTIEESPTESEGGKQLSVTPNNADENTAELLPDLSLKSIKNVEQESDSGRKLLGLPEDLPEKATSTEPKIKQKTELMHEIESILDKVKEQYNKRDHPESAPVTQDKVSSEVNPAQYIKDLLKLPASQGNDEMLKEDPVIEAARQRYMSIWNQEADRLNAPFMKITKAWPELGMAYMPVVTQVTDQIKQCDSLKEAERAFKEVWERRRTEINSPPTEAEPMLKILNNFMNAWLWAETTEEASNTPEADVDNDEEGPILPKSNVGKEKVSRHDDSLLRTNVMTDFDSPIETIYRTIFNQKRVQPTVRPNSDSNPAAPFATLDNNKITLSCSVVPAVVLHDPIAQRPVNIGKRPAPYTDHRPNNNPIANIRPFIDSFMVRNPTRENPNANVRPNAHNKEQQLINPVVLARPAPDSTAIIRQAEDSIDIHQPVIPSAYLEFVKHSTVNRPVIGTDGKDSEEDISQSFESGE